MNRSELHKDVGKSRPQGNRIHADPPGATSISTQIIRQDHDIRQWQVTGLSQANLSVYFCIQERVVVPPRAQLSGGDIPMLFCKMAATRIYSRE